MCWLITGAAGYIGAHVTRAMLEAGEEVIAYDDLSTGDAARIADVELVQGSDEQPGPGGGLRAAHRAGAGLAGPTGRQGDGLLGVGGLEHRWTSWVTG